MTPSGVGGKEADEALVMRHNDDTTPVTRAAKRMMTNLTN